MTETGVQRVLSRAMLRLLRPMRESTGEASFKKGFWSSEEGAELVEFAVSSLVLLVVLFGIIESCIVFYMWNTAAESAREASRWASVRGTDCNNPNITDGSCTAGVGASAAQIQAYAQSFPGAGNMNVSVEWCSSSGANCGSETATPGNIVQVNVAYSFASVPFVSANALSVSSTSQSVVW